MAKTGLNEICPKQNLRWNFDGLARRVTTPSSDPSQFLNTLLLTSDVRGISGGGKNLWKHFNLEIIITSFQLSSLSLSSSAFNDLQLLR